MDQILWVKAKTIRRGKKKVRWGDEKDERGRGEEEVETGKGTCWEGRYLSEEELVTA